MDTDLFLERCEEIEEGMHKLANDFYHSLNEGAPGEIRDNLLLRAKEKVSLFESLSLDIEDEDEEEEIQTFNRYINKFKEYILMAEKERE